MGGGEAAGVTGVGESPAFHAIGPGGIQLKKKVMPKRAPKKLTVKKHWKASFQKFATKISGNKRGS